MPFQEVLNHLVAGQIYTFILVFTRVGAALMIMPALGDSFVSPRIRLLFALALSVVVTPVLEPLVPDVTVIGNGFLLMVCMEVVIGLFIGTMARILISTLDTAGMLISMQMGLANAQVFNPGMATQGSIVGAVLSVTGVLLLFVTDLHHILIYAVFDSYQSFPPGHLPAAEGMSQMITMTVAKSFAVGVQLAMPFIVVAMMSYVGMGVLARVMPQIQVFIFAMPIQILLGLVTFLLVSSVLFLAWLQYFQDGMMFFLGRAQ